MTKPRGAPRHAPKVTIYQFKIVLLGAEPVIWRRIQTRDCTLDALHDVLQVVMGWKSGAEYRFDLHGQEFADPDQFEETFRASGMRDARRTMLSQIVPQAGQPCPLFYEYDFAEGWRHEIVFEGNPAADPKAIYPSCLEGERACPPATSGGSLGTNLGAAGFDLRHVQRLLHSCMLRQ